MKFNKAILAALVAIFFVFTSCDGLLSGLRGIDPKISDF